MCLPRDVFIVKWPGLLLDAGIGKKSGNQNKKFHGYPMPIAWQIKNIEEEYYGEF